MEEKIIVLNCELVKMKFDDGKEKEFNKVQYAIRINEDTEKFKGLNILTCYCNADSFDISSSIIGEPTTAIITKRPTSNGTKYVLSSLDEVEI